MQKLILGVSMLVSCLTGQVFAQAGGETAGYRIEVELEAFLESEAYLANYFMDKQYIVDTSAVEDGKVIFSGDEPLPRGTYLLVLPPDNNFAQVQIGEDQHFSLRTNVENLSANMAVEGSGENELFYDYIQFLAQMRPKADSLRALTQDSSLAPEARTAAEAAMDEVDQDVEARQQTIMKEHAETMTAAILRGLRDPEIPAFEGTDAEVQEKRYRYYKTHYFDGIDLADPRMLRSSFLDERISYYLEKLVIPAPDSIAAEIDYILEQMKPAEETFRFYTSKFLNDYASSKIVGMDAVYVHLAEKYYMSGIASWTDSTTIAKITENVERTKPLLIGKQAPPLTVIKRSGEQVSLTDLDAAFTVLFFYDPECGHCKKQTPFVIDFAKAYQERGVQVVSVCSKFAPGQDSCWSYVDKNEGMASAVLNGIDPYHRSKFKIRYDISSTPQVFVLDSKKRIVSKKISAEQLEEVLDRLLAIRDEQVQKEEQGR